jgi:hypothetical protein
VLVEVAFIGVEPAGFAVADAAEEVAVAVFPVVADSKSELCQTRRTPSPRLKKSMSSLIKVVVTYWVPEPSAYQPVYEKGNVGVAPHGHVVVSNIDQESKQGQPLE